MLAFTGGLLAVLLVVQTCGQIENRPPFITRQRPTRPLEAVRPTLGVRIVTTPTYPTIYSTLITTSVHSLVLTTTVTQYRTGIIPITATSPSSCSPTTSIPDVPFIPTADSETFLSPITEDPALCRLFHVENCVATSIRTRCLELCSTKIGPVCNSNSKCGDRGGFCIPKDKPCNGNTPSGDGYCSDNGNCKCCLGPTVYMKDIENTITYALKNRAVFVEDGNSTRNLTETDLSKLSKFVEALTNYLELRSPMEKFLNCFKHQIDQQVTTEHRPQKIITGHEINNKIEMCERETKVYLPKVDRLQWNGCRNPANAQWLRVRTYPCGVWTTFHAMSVNLPEENATALLPTLHGLVEYFPWCLECQTDFLKMYVGDVSHPEFFIEPAVDMKTKDQVITWLWHAHNIVNMRIPYADTHFPNTGRSHLVFPGLEQCVPKETCWDKDGAYNTTRMITYLKNMYQPSAIIDIE